MLVCGKISFVFDLLATQHFKIKNVASAASRWQHCVRFEYSPFELFKPIDPETNALPLTLVIVLESDYFTKNFKIKEKKKKTRNIFAAHFSFTSFRIEIWVRIRV